LMNLLLDLTIIIPNYNTKALLQQCLASIYRYTRGIQFEVICIDDGSTDGSAEMVESAFPEVILVRNPVALLYSKNNNLGMKMSRARYACLLNSDTKLVGNVFKVLVGFMDAHPEAAACGPRLLNPDGTTQSCVRSFAGLGTMILQGLNWHKFFPNGQVSREYYACSFDYSREQQVESLGTTAYVLRRETWETFGMLDERLPHFQVDLAYNLMLKRNGCKIYYTPSAEVIHYGSQSINQMPRKKIIEQHRAMIDFNEHYDYFGKNRLLKLVVRGAVAARCMLKIAEFHLSSDKRVIKGPGAPRLNAIDRTVMHREDLRSGAD
jgi:N-acetylglucosaminyl-diphospho-decaprenol L-rhamnosyltransferase